MRGPNGDYPIYKSLQKILSIMEEDTGERLRRASENGTHGQEKFILEKMPLGVIVYGPGTDILYCNPFAANLFSSYSLPDEVETICGRIFTAIEESKLKEQFPGEIYCSKKLDHSSRHCIFRFEYAENPHPCVAVFIHEESVANKVDLNNIRKLFRLTRRESDILRRVLNGFKNNDIARDCGISPQTVKDHLSRIYSKFEVKNRFALIRFLINSSLLR